MSRSAWKFQSFNDADIINYFYYIINSRKYIKKEYVKRSDTINIFNYRKKVFIHQGKFTIKRKLTQFHINFKIGQFVKTKKPCFFRSKKNK